MSIKCEMTDLAKRFFSKKERQGNAENEVPHDIHVATCALLLEMSKIDDEFSDAEKEQIVSILKKEPNISEENIDLLLKLADDELKGSIDLWQFTNLINQNYTVEEKIRIIEMIWKVAFADGKLDQHEDYLVHKLANLLRLNHRQLIDAKLRTKEDLDINKEQGLS
jgi:uncharacterized tellurite resistance protein B-like protein